MLAVVLMACALMAFALGALAPAAQAQTVYHVTEGGTASNNGNSFNSDPISLQEALSQATGNDVIVIEAGTYTPSEQLDAIEPRSATFEVTGNENGLKIYGGFAGTESGGAFSDPTEVESALEGRDLATNETILSGDLNGDDADTDGDGIPDSNRGDNAYHVLIFDGGSGIGTDVAADITGDTVIGGVTVSGGNADGDFSDGGSDQKGGGLYCDGNGGSGGNSNVCSPQITDVTFSGNSASFRGGAIYNDGGSVGPVDGVSSPKITSSTFSGNSADSRGGAIYNDGFGGTSSPVITNAIFTGNSAFSISGSDTFGRGGAIYNEGAFGTSSPMITNAIFTSNSAGEEGGAIFNLELSSGSSMSSPQIINTIFWGNTAGSEPEVGNSNATPTFAHSLIAGSGGSSSWDSSLGTDGGNNLDADPLFVDAAHPAGNDGAFATDDDGLRVAGNSPAVDAGDNTPFQMGGIADDIDTDLIGDPRIQDGASDGTATVSLGAYEAPGLPIATSVTITGTDGTGDPADIGWRIVSVPYVDAVAGDLRMTHSAGTNAPRFGRNVVAVWDDSDSDESTGGTGAYEIADATTSLPNGSAALMYLEDDTRDPVESDGLTVSLDENTAATLQGTAPVVRNDLTKSARWHLLGNPYPTDYELSVLTTGGSALDGNGFQEDAQVYDAIGGTWETVSTATATATLAAWQGFFIERSNPTTGPAQVTFESAGRTDAGAPFIGSAMQGPTTAATSVQRGTLGIEGIVTDAEGNTVATDRAIGVRFHENASAGWDAWDTSKLAPLETPSLMLSAQGTGSGGGEAAKAIESRPWPQNPNDPAAPITSVPFGVDGNELPDSSTLTVQVQNWDLPDTWAAELIDTQGTTDTNDDQTAPFGPGISYAIDVRSLSANPETERFVVQIAPNAGALPVELAAFKAQRSGSESVTVHWQTLSETNNAGFEVQRRIAPAETPDPDVSRWQTMGTIEGAGTTDTPQSYRFEDSGLPYAADSLAYRLRQIDTGGTASLSEEVVIARPVEATELLPTYPNPARSTATVRFAVPDRQAVRITLYDMLGRRVQTVVRADAEGRTEHVLDVSRLASGTYFLRMETEAGPVDTQRMTVVR